VQARETTRRDVLRRTVTLGAGALAATAVPALLDVRAAFAAAADDAAVLRAAVTLENTAVAAYAAAIRSGRLAPDVLAAAKLFKRQEQEHAAALSAALRKLGQTPPTGTDAKVLAPLAKAGDQAAIVRFAIELETMAVAAYYDAAKKLRDAALLTTGVQIMADEGQHLAVLRAALGRNPAPNSFETGE
jgi:rubrerythrin